jgi:hypothetical protein
MCRRQRVEEASEPLYDRFYITGRAFDFPVSYSMVAEVCGGSGAKLAVKGVQDGPAGLAVGAPAVEEGWEGVVVEW